MSSRRIEPEMIVAIAAVVVGVCALGVSLFQASIMRRQQEEMNVQRRAEVWPHMEFGTSYSGEGFRLIAFNAGIGPARVESVRLLVDGEAVQDWPGFFRAVGGTEGFTYKRSRIGGRVLPAGEMLEALVVQTPALADSLASATGRIVAEICYCSVYDQCWQFRQDFASSPTYEPIAICTTPDGAFEQ